MSTATQPEAGTGTDEWDDAAEAFPDLDSRLDAADAQWQKDHPEEAETPASDQLDALLRVPDPAEPTDQPAKKAGDDPDQTGTREGAGKPTDQQQKNQEGKEQSPKPTDEGADDPQKSKYAREQERRDRSWKALNEEKARVAEQEAKLAAERKTWEEMVREQAATKARAQQAPTDPADKPETWDAAAVKWEKAGKYDLADQARAEAKRLREQAATARQTPAAPAPGDPVAEVRKQAALAATWGQVRQSMPEFFDKAHPLNASMQQFINENPEVFEHPRGPLLAAQHLKLKHDLAESQKAASRVPELEKEITGLQAKVKELEALTSIDGGSGSPTRIQGERRFEDLSIEEQERELEASLRGR